MSTKRTSSAQDAQRKELKQIPGVGISIADDLLHIGIKSIADLKDRDPEALYDRSNRFAGRVQDRCLLYVFRCAVYFASTEKHDKKKLKWWYWKNHTI
jgi:nucleotidyltransferase/DNA polymerase involved in DNA repair